MAVFVALLIKLIPLYLLILLGMIAGRFLKVNKETIAPLLVYLIAPVVFFHGAATAHLTWKLLSLPAVFFALTVVFCLVFYALGKRIFPDATAHLLAYSAGAANSGYFGLPVAIALFGERSMGILIAGAMAFTLYETTFGYFMLARGRHTAKESFLKVLKLPVVYGFLLGLIANAMHIPLGQTYIDMAASFRGAFTVLGMMMIGLALSSMKHVNLDLTYISFSFLAKFVAWPLVVGGIIYLDLTYWHIYDPLTHNVMLLLSIVPLAVNTVVFSTLLNIHPEKAATAVLLSTIVALFYIPLVATFAF